MKDLNKIITPKFLNSLKSSFCPWKIKDFKELRKIIDFNKINQKREFDKLIKFMKEIHRESHEEDQLEDEIKADLQHSLYKISSRNNYNYHIDFKCSNNYDISFDDYRVDIKKLTEILRKKK